MNAIVVTPVISERIENMRCTREAAVLPEPAAPGRPATSPECGMRSWGAAGATPGGGTWVPRGGSQGRRRPRGYEGGEGRESIESRHSANDVSPVVVR